MGRLLGWSQIKNLCREVFSKEQYFPGDSKVTADT
ncbi:rCG39359, isoform CRA_b [Rattus norvegicus]|uniref:RCG39359, isoform CRA_b n=1 Tax=Rattus norvegicus TaxID=10116 RepID=A6I9F4_RAT|nr:rCG39359, isoform CRA_b [Rattus norvegicus]